MKSKLDQKGEESPESSAKSQTMMNAMEDTGMDSKGKDQLHFGILTLHQNDKYKVVQWVHLHHMYRQYRDILT